MSIARALLLMVAAPLLLAGCGNGGGGGGPAEDATSATGILEVIHASQDAPAVNVLVDGDVAFDGLPFKGTAAAELPAGDYAVEVEGIVPGGNVTVIPAQGDAPVIPLGADQRVTVVAVNEVSAIEPIVLTDEPPAVPAGEVRVRVLHAASNAPTVDVYVTAPGDPLDAPTGTFSFGELLSADPLLVPAGEYRVRVTPAGSDTVVFDSGPVDLAGGSDLVIAAVTNTGPGESPIRLLVATGAEALELVDVDTPSAARAIHASADAPAVDLVVNDDFANRPVTNLAFGEFTDYLTLEPGTVNVKVVPTGADSPAVIDEDVTLTIGEAYSVYAADELASIQPLVLVDDLRRVATEARLRLVHVSPSAGEVDIYVVEGGTGGNLDGVDPAFAAVPFLADTGYVSLAPGSYDVVVTQTGSTVPAIGPVTLDLAGGGLYTAAAVDQLNGGLPPTLIQLDDLAP